MSKPKPKINIEIRTDEYGDLEFLMIHDIEGMKIRTAAVPDPVIFDGDAVEIRNHEIQKADGSWPGEEGWAEFYEREDLGKLQCLINEKVRQNFEVLRKAVRCAEQYFENWKEDSPEDFVAS